MRLNLHNAAICVRQLRQPLVCICCLHCSTRAALIVDVCFNGNGCALVNPRRHIERSQSICKSISSRRIRRLIDEGGIRMHRAPGRSGREAHSAAAASQILYNTHLMLMRRWWRRRFNSPGKTRGVSQNHNALGPICHFDGP